MENKLKFDTVFKTGSTLEGVRDIDIGAALIDVTKRESDRNGHFDIDVTVHVRPGENPRPLEKAAQLACVDIFGDRHPSDLDIELFYHDGNRTGVGFEFDGSPQSPNVSFGFKVKHPKSVLYNLDRLKETFTTRFKFHAMG